MAQKTFLEENSWSLFSINFNEMSMLDLISDEQIREKLREAKHLIEQDKYQLAIQAFSEAFNELQKKFRLNLMPHWAVECGADQVTLFYIFRYFPQVGDRDPPAIEWMTPSKKTCEFIHELIVETTIKVEQTFSGRWERIDEVIQGARGPAANLADRSGL